MARFDARQGASHIALLAQLTPHALRSGVPWLLTTRAGWERFVGHPLAARLKTLLIDERTPQNGEVSGFREGPAGKVTWIPLEDPGHRRLREAWKEVFVAPESLV